MRPGVVVGVALLGLSPLDCADKGSLAGGARCRDVRVERDARPEELPADADTACDYAEPVELGPSDVTAYGITVAEFVERFRGPVVSELHWDDYDWWDAAFTHRPGPGTSSLSLGLGESIGLALQYDEAPWGPGDARLCDGAMLLVLVGVELASEDGALAESFQTTLRAGGPNTASIYHDLPLSSLCGNFEIRSEELEFESPGLSVEALLWPGGSSGEIRPTFERVWHVHGEQATPGSELEATGNLDPIAVTPERPPEPSDAEDGRCVARWPFAEQCSEYRALSSDAPLMGVSARQVLATMSDLPLVIEPQGAAPQHLSLEFEALPDIACLGTTGDALLLTPGVTIRSEELGLNASMFVRVIARTSLFGELSEISLRRWETEYRQPSAGGDVEAALGLSIEGADSFARVCWSFDGTYLLEGDRWTATGELLVHGLDTIDGSAGSSSGGAGGSTGDDSSAAAAECPFPPQGSLYSAVWSG
jgi:hypothetical protein